MLTTALFNANSYFSPVGSTAAGSLTQAIPLKPETNILLLGCGDVRNILFTGHVDARAMDITCCDVQKAVLARNILLLSLLVDDENSHNDDLIWSIYYHLNLEKKAIDLLRSQATKLHDLSATFESWRQSKYGAQLKFCDSATLADVRGMWEFYAVERKGIDLELFKDRFERVLKKARKEKAENDPSNGSHNSGVAKFRSAIPAHANASEDLDALHRYFWEYGTTELNKKERAKSKHPNPMFLTLEDEGVIHYDTDPLHGFHLATAFAPLAPDSPLFSQLKGLLMQRRIVTVARMEFRSWATSYRKHFANIKIRFSAGDAISFAHTLQHKRITGEETARWYRHQYDLRQLALDDSDYASGVAPLTFDVIDTSTLCEQVGSLILLTAASPLLSNQLASVLYTEINTKCYTTYENFLEGMLCGHVPTVSTLLGVVPVEYWTNTSTLSYGDAKAPDEESGGNTKHENEDWGLIDMFLKTTWRRPICTEDSSGPCAGLMKIKFHGVELAHILHKVYSQMFLEEELGPDYTQRSPQTLLNACILMYHRASFVSFVRLVKTRVTCDWEATMRKMVELIDARDSTCPTGMPHIQELFIYLHMLDVIPSAVLTEWHNRNTTTDPDLIKSYGRIRLSTIPEEYEDIRDWEDIPSIVCVTLKIPRQELDSCNNKFVGAFGTPRVHGVLQGNDWTHSVAPTAAGIRTTSRGSIVWQYFFSACQLAFGELSTSGTRNDDSFQVFVAEDDRGWSGTSDLILSYYVPSFFLLVDPRGGIAALGLDLTPSNMQPGSPLDLDMNVYETVINNKADVYITRHGPNRDAFPAIPGFALEDLAASEVANPYAKPSLEASVHKQTGRIQSFTSRLDLTSEQHRSALGEAGQAQKSTLSPFQVGITIGEQHRLVACFPVYVIEATQKLAAGGSSVAVKAQVATSAEWIEYPYFMYPVYLRDGKPLNWNMPRLDLQFCPVVDIEDSSNMDWLVSYSDLSLRELALSENDTVPPRLVGEQIRLDVKWALCQLFHQFAKHGRDGCNAFGVRDVTGENRNAHLLIFTSKNSLRLDLANRVPVLDCAVLPLYPEVRDKFGAENVELLTSSEERIDGYQYEDVGLNGAELKLLKALLPAWVDRCRTWEHKDECEYAAAASAGVPLAVEPDRPFLCSCGNGMFPPGFVDCIGEEAWGFVSAHAVRAAITPAFFAPFEISGCAGCGRQEQDDLKACDRCKKVRYCGKDCQKKDWDAAHKVACVKRAAQD